MNSFYQKSRNGMLLIKEAFKTMLQFKHVAFFILIMLTCNLFLFATFIDIEYQSYGVHLFDHKTLSSLLSLGFWSHMGHTLFILAFIFIMMFVSLFFKFALFYLVIEQLSQKNGSIFQAFLIPFKRMHEFTRIVILYTFGFIASLTNVTSLSTHAETAQNITTGTLKDEYSEYEKPEGVLLIPLIIENNLHTLAALEKSEKMLKAKFGDTMQVTYSLFGIELLTWLFTFVIIGGFVHFGLGYHPFTAIIACTVVIITISSIINNVKILFDSALYNYCKGQPIGRFKEKDLIKMFKEST